MILKEDNTHKHNHVGKRLRSEFVVLRPIRLRQKNNGYSFYPRDLYERQSQNFKICYVGKLRLRKRNQIYSGQFKVLCENEHKRQLSFQNSRVAQRRTFDVRRAIGVAQKYRTVQFQHAFLFHHQRQAQVAETYSFQVV